MKLGKLVKKGLSYIIRYYPNLRECSKFFHTHIEEKTVLIVEPNMYHGECLPSFIEYFYTLGYQVHCLLRVEQKAYNPFVRMKKKPLSFYMDFSFFSKIMLSTKVKEYEYIFFSTSCLCEASKKYQPESIIQLLGEMVEDRCILMEHTITPNIEVLGHTRFIGRGQCATCFDFIPEIPMISPNYFGDVVITDKNEHTIFAVFIKDDGEFLFTAVRKLLEEGIYNFSVVIVGRVSVKRIPDDLTSYISVTGKIDFSRLFSLIETADFIIPSLDINNEPHKRYMKDCCTGAFNLMQGFCTPLLITKDFAPSYKLDRRSAIIYDTASSLIEAMKTAICMEKTAYTAMQKVIQSMSAEYSTISLQNMSQILEGIEQQSIANVRGKTKF